MEITGVGGLNSKGSYLPGPRPVLAFRGLAFAAAAAGPDLPVVTLVERLRPEAPALCLLVPVGPLTALVVVGTVALSCFLLGGTSRGFTTFPVGRVLAWHLSEQQEEKEKEEEEMKQFCSMSRGSMCGGDVQTQLERRWKAWSVRMREQTMLV